MCLSCDVYRTVLHSVLFFLFFFFLGYSPTSQSFFWSLSVNTDDASVDELTREQHQVCVRALL